jgi:hypothetical protein
MHTEHSAHSLHYHSPTTVPCTSIGQTCTKHPASKLPPLVSLSPPQESTIGCAPLLASTTGHASPWWYPWGMRRKRWGDHDAEAWVVARILGKVKMVERRLCKTTDFLTNIGKLELFRCYHPSFFYALSWNSGDIMEQVIKYMKHCLWRMLDVKDRRS